MPTRSIKIKFNGGPFDGHCQPFPARTVQKWLALPVAEDTLRLLQGKRLGRPTPISTVARYELVESVSGWDYRFVETVAVKDVDLERLLEVAKEIGEAKKWGRRRSDS